MGVVAALMAAGSWQGGIGATVRRHDKRLDQAEKYCQLYRADCHARQDRQQQAIIDRLDSGSQALGNLAGRLERIEAVLNGRLKDH